MKRIATVFPEHFQSSCKIDFVVSHPFRKEREMDGARSFLTLSMKTLSSAGQTKKLEPRTFRSSSFFMPYQFRLQL